MVNFASCILVYSLQHFRLYYFQGSQLTTETWKSKNLIQLASVRKGALNCRVEASHERFKFHTQYLFFLFMHVKQIWPYKGVTLKWGMVIIFVAEFFYDFLARTADRLLRII